MFVSDIHKEVLYSGPFRPFSFLLNKMRRSSPAFFEKKNIFTKPLDETRFCKLRSKMNVIDLSNVA
jgi:hypothetical protein